MDWSVLRGHEVWGSYKFNMQSHLHRVVYDNQKKLIVQKNITYDGDIVGEEAESEYNWARQQ